MKTDTIQPGLNRMLAILSERDHLPFRKASLDRSSGYDFHVLPGPPDVHVSVTCEPPQANDIADLALRGGDAQWVPRPSRDGSTWRLKRPVGQTDVRAMFSGREVPRRRAPRDDLDAGQRFHARGQAMTRLSIGVSKYLEGEESLATGRIVDIDQGLTQAVRVPVGHGRFIEVDVEPGRYLVQVDMPFGRPLSRSINVAAGEPIRRVELEGPHSDHEWLSWSNFSTGAGALGSTPRRLDFSPALEAQRVADHQIELWVGSHRVPIGSGSSQMTLDGVDFDVKIDLDWPNLVARIFTLSNAPDMGQVPRTFVVARTGAERKFMTVPVPWINYQAQGDPRRAVDVLISETLFDPDADRDVPPPHGWP